MSDSFLLDERKGGIELTWSGAAVDAAYRSYLAEFGSWDGATRGAYRAAGNRQELVEWVSAEDADSVARALARGGLHESARKVRMLALRAEADLLRDRADALEYEADELRRAAYEVERA